MEVEFLKNKQIEIQDIFTKLFNSKGYKATSFFDRTVWFMKKESKY